MSTDTTDDGSEIDSQDGFVHGMKGAKIAPEPPSSGEFHSADGARRAAPPPPRAEATGATSEARNGEEQASPAPATASPAEKPDTADSN